jgi:hypothetical protein
MTEGDRRVRREGPGQDVRIRAAQAHFRRGDDDIGFAGHRLWHILDGEFSTTAVAHGAHQDLPSIGLTVACYMQHDECRIGYGGCGGPRRAGRTVTRE